MSYKYLGEDEHSYQVQHPGGEPFKIAKAGLQKNVIDQIEGFRGMAQGGIVEDPVTEDSNPVDDALTFDPMGGLPDHIPSRAQMQANRLTEISDFNAKANPGLNPTEVDLLSLGQAESEKSAQEAMQARADASASQGKALQSDIDSRKAALLGEAPKLSLADQAAQDQAAAMAELQGMPQAQGVAQPQGQGQGSPVGGLQREVDNITGQMSQAYTGLAQEQEKAAALQEQIYAKQAADLESMTAKYNEKYAAMEEERQTIMKDIADDKIDPRRMFNEMSTGRRVATTIGLILSGIGAGATGTENDGLKLLNSMVDRDIEAQKLQMSKKDNLLKMNMQQTGDLRQAEMQTKLQMAAAVEAQIRMASARSQSAQAKLNGQLAISKVRAEMLPMQQKLAAESAARANPALANNMPFESAYYALPEKMRDQAVKLPGERMGIAINAGAAKELNTAIPIADETEAILSQILDESKFKFMPDAEKGQLMSMAKQALLKLKSTEKLGALDKGSVEVSDAIIGDPTSFFQSRERGKTQSLLESIRRQKENMLKQNLIGYRPSQVQFTPKKAK